MDDTPETNLGPQNLKTIKDRNLHEAHVPKPKLRFGGTARNSGHGRMGVLDMIRQATTIQRVEELLILSQKMTPSTQTEKKILLAAKRAIERLSHPQAPAAPSESEKIVGVDLAKGDDKTVVVERDPKTNEVTIVTLSPSPLHEEITREPSKPKRRNKPASCASRRAKHSRKHGLVH